MRVGQLAAKAGVNLQTIRFYERQGLLRHPPRTSSGYRNYSPADVERITFIKWCQPLGFTLKEVGELVQLHTAVANLPSARKPTSAKELRRIIGMAEEKLAELQRKIKRLNLARRDLSFAIRKLQTPEPACPASLSSTRRAAKS